MKILHVTGMPFPTKLGSLEKWFMEFCKQADQKDATTYVAYYQNTGNVGPYSEKIVEHGGKLVVLETDASVEAFCREQNISVVHFHFDFEGYKSLYKHLHNAGIKLYAHLHCENYYFVNQEWKKHLKSYIRISGHRMKTWYAARFFEYIFPVASQVAMENKKLYRWPDNKVSVLYLGIQKLQNVQTGKRSTSKTPIIACTAFHSPIKGVDVLLHALAILDSRHIPFKLIEIGGGSSDANGEDTQQLLQLSKSLGLAEKIEWVGVTNDVYSYLEKADIYCQPSRTEALPLSIAESMQCGLPIVASNVGGVRELVIDGQNGYTVPADDPTALATALEELIIHPELRAKFGAQSTEILDEIGFYQDESVKKVWEFYSK